MQLLRSIPLLLFLLIKVKTLFAKDVFWSDRIESQLLQSMFLQAYKGKWFPMSNKTIPFDEFMLKGGRLYKDGDNIPFTGWYAQYDEREEPRMLSSFVDGKKNGFTYLWDGNGTRRFQGEYATNKKNGQFLEWNEQAMKVSEKNYSHGKLNGKYSLWYDNGKRKLEALFISGKLSKARGWYPDGNPCPYSKVANGRGVILRYENNYKPADNISKRGAVPSSAFEKLKELQFENSEEGVQSTNHAYESDQFHLDLPKSD